MTGELTKRQVAILKYIARYVYKHGYQPSYRDMMDEFGIRSLNGIRSHLRAAERKGFCKLGEGCSRAIAFDWQDYL